MVLSRCNLLLLRLYRSIATEPFYARGSACRSLYGQNPLAERDEYTYK